MRQRHGSMHAQAWGPALGIAERADGAARHRSHHRSGLSAEHEQILELQRQAGNAAVTQALHATNRAGFVNSVDRLEISREGMDPKTGIQQIRSHTKNKSTLALTQRGIENNPPIMRPEPAEKTKDGYRAKPQKVDSIPEPMIHEWWPKEGLHLLADGSYREVTHDWEKALEKGEDEHRDDARLAWEMTWKKVQDTINAFAEKPGPSAPTADEAQNQLWKSYVAALPEGLRPAGDKASDTKQREALQISPWKNFSTWAWEITVARDGRMNHETIPGPSTEGVQAPKDAMVTGIAKHPSFQVPGPTSKDLFEDVAKKYVPGQPIKNSQLKEGDSSGDTSK
jgi:hypothetical protein